VIARLAATRRRLVLLGAAVLLLGGAAVAVAAHAAGGSGAPASPSSGHRDYLDDSTGGRTADPCALPVAQRTGGWFCPAGTSRP
jgi:hypothetical protein